MASVRFVNFEETRPSRAQRSAADRFAYHYFGGGPSFDPEPQAFLAHMPARDALRTHFHDIDQFQLFFEAPGFTFQRRPVSRLDAHYVDAFVPYGPISPGDEAAHFMTLRPVHTDFRGFMPEERDKLLHRGRRNMSIDVASSLGCDPLAPREVRVEELVPAHDDNLAAFLLGAGPRATFDAPSSVGSSGQYHYVIEGRAETASGRIVSERALGWCDPDATVHYTAGNEGCTILVLQFPSPPTFPLPADRGCA
jgi:hypothetical protein